MEMKMGLMRIVVLISAVIFVAIYSQLISKKNVQTAIFYGFLFGISAGISMGYGTYAVMPIPYYMALTWFLGSLMEGIAAGLITGLIVRE